MKKLNKYAQSSSLMKISLEYGMEKFQFNLFDELQINESIIANEIKQQPNSYAFLSMLQTNIMALVQKAKVSEEKMYYKLYDNFKAKTNPQTNRPNSDDVAKAKATKHKMYVAARNKTINLSKQLSTISNCVKAFEQRSSLIQTLSANRRKESY